MLTPHGAHETVTPGISERRVSLHLRDEPAEGASCHRSVHRADPGSKRCEEITPKRPGIWHRLLGEKVRSEGLECQQAFRRPASVDGGFADACELGHILHRQRDESDLLEQLLGRRQYGALCFLSSRSSPTGRNLRLSILYGLNSSGNIFTIRIVS